MTTKHQIQYVSPGDIKPYWNNPRNNDAAVEGIKQSIQQFSFLVPLVVDADHVIITGHTRYKAAVELGLTEIPVIVATNLTDKQTKAYRIADNRVSENAEWDEVKLAAELQSLVDMGFDAFTGFSKEELDCLCGVVTADCLDDLNHAAICGTVDERVLTAKNDVIVSVGNYRFYISMTGYKAWEKKLLAEYPKRIDAMQEIMKRLGFTIADLPDLAKMVKTKKKSSQSSEDDVLDTPTVQ
jgi:hypothetical protein